MIWKIWQRSVGALGVELGPRSVRMVQLHQGDGAGGAAGDGAGGGVAAMAVRTAGEAELAQPCAVDDQRYHELARGALAELIERVQPTGRRVVTAVPVGAMHFQNVRLPPMPEAELAEAARWELSLDDGPRELRCFNAGEVRHGEQRQMELIAMSVRQDYLEAHLAMLDGLGLVVEAIDAVPAALARTVGEQPCVMIAELDWRGTNVVIARQGQIAFFKALPIGLDAIHGRSSAPAQREQPEPAGIGRLAAGASAPQPGVAELARELALCLRYHSVTFRGQRPERLVVAGVGGEQPEIVEALGQHTGLEVEAASTPGTLGASWCVAAGLALRRVGMGPIHKPQERAA